MVNSGKQLIPCETIISAYTGETPMLPWPLCLTPFPRTSGFLRIYLPVLFVLFLEIRGSKILSLGHLCLLFDFLARQAI